MCSERPGASLTAPMRVRLRARLSSGAAPIPITPTRATSPSSSAFIACVVEYATSCTLSRSSPSSANSSPSASATPCATPVGSWWLVGTTAWARSSTGWAETATALVNVPPTSTPTRSTVMQAPR